MDTKEYGTIYSVEDNHWWYVALRKLVLGFVDDVGRNKKGQRILDAGCGTGGMLAECSAYQTFGLDVSEEALKFCRMRKLRNLSKGSICALHFEDSFFTTVISLDVLYHVGVSDDIKALKEFYRVMEHQGVLIMNLPAYNFLMSSHDKMNHTRHRYTLRELRKKVESAGFTVERITYRNTFLFPIASVMRLLKKVFPSRDGERKSDLKPLPHVINRVLTDILIWENKLIMRGLNFPFGLSIFCVARKN
jgi:SAM-dependent methyltransferase